MIYTLKKNEYGDILGCSRCQAEVPTMTMEKRTYGSCTKWELCSVCGSMFIENLDGNTDRLSINMAQIANEIIAQLEKTITEGKTIEALNKEILLLKHSHEAYKSSSEQVALIAQAAISYVLSRSFGSTKEQEECFYQLRERCRPLLQSREDWK